MPDTMTMKQARKLYRGEKQKGERRSFRAWARFVYADDRTVVGKLARILRRAS